MNSFINIFTYLILILIIFYAIYFLFDKNDVSLFYGNIDNFDYFWLWRKLLLKTELFTFIIFVDDDDFLTGDKLIDFYEDNNDGGIIEIYEKNDYNDKM